MSVKTTKIVYWISTGVFGAGMAFSAVLYLFQPEMQENFIHLGFPRYFSVELGIFKLLGVLALLIPAVPRWLKEWAYAGFFINLVSASIAHAALGDGALKIAFPMIYGLIYLASYVSFRQLQGELK